MIRVTRSSPKSGSRKRKRRAAKAKAAIEQLISWPTVLSRASLTELTKNVANGRAFHMSP